MSAIPPRLRSPLAREVDLNALIPDFPFDYAAYLQNPTQGRNPLGVLPPAARGRKVLVVGAGVAGLVAAYELMRLGLHPVVVEAGNRLGGRMYAASAGGTSSRVIAEMGSMRFPVSGKSLYHYFDKVGMTANSAPFPNPGSEAAVSTVVDYQGRQQYYEWQSEKFPIPPEYTELENDFFDRFLEQDPIRFSDMERAMSTGSIDQALIKQIWNQIIKPGGSSDGSWDNLSFHAAMVEQARWDADKINLFGQVGFGTGGWNTDYPNSFLEVLRVLYTGLDVDHRLMYDGTSALPQQLFTRTPASMGDLSPWWPGPTSVASLSAADFPSPLNREVRHISRRPDGQFDVLVTNTLNGQTTPHVYPAVVYTPHVRILDKSRYRGTPNQFRATTNLLDQDLWEAIMYTHYMQSTKVFAATKEPFWQQRLPDGKRRMSITLSDRLTRGTYLVDYGPSTGAIKGSGIFLSYTWNDDSLKMLGETGVAGAQLHAGLCETLLESIFPDAGLLGSIATDDPYLQQSWETQALYLGAFKMNLPGQYSYQRRIFSQFMDGVGTERPDPFVLAGDDVSWTGGWAEGAVTTAINAVDKLVSVNGGTRYTRGPVDSFEQLGPVSL